MPGPQAAQILQMSHPVTEESGKCPAVARGGEGTGRSSVELTDALGMYAAVFKQSMLKSPMIWISLCLKYADSMLFSIRP